MRFYFSFVLLLFCFVFTRLLVSGILHWTSAKWQSILLALMLVKTVLHTGNKAESETPPEGCLELVAVMAQKQAHRIYWGNEGSEPISKKKCYYIKLFFFIIMVIIS